MKRLAAGPPSKGTRTIPPPPARVAYTASDADPMKSAPVILGVHGSAIEVVSPPPAETFFATLGDAASTTASTQYTKPFTTVTPFTGPVEAMVLGGPPPMGTATMDGPAPIGMVGKYTAVESRPSDSMNP